MIARHVRLRAIASYEKTPEKQGFVMECEDSQNAGITPQGDELDSVTGNDANGLQKQADSSCAYSVQNPPDVRLQMIIDAWPTLTEDVKNMIRDLC